MHDIAQPQKRCEAKRQPDNPGGQFLRAAYNDCAASHHLLCYSSGSEKLCSPEADGGAPRAVVYIPAQHLFYIPVLLKCAWLATCLHWLLPPFPPQDSFSLWKNEIISLLSQSSHIGKQKQMRPLVYGFPVAAPRKLGRALFLEFLPILWTQPWVSAFPVGRNIL